MSVWWSGKLEERNSSLKPFILSCWEENTSWPLLSQLGQVPDTILLSMWPYSSDEDILPQEHCGEKTSPHSACWGIFRPFQLSWGWLCLYPWIEQKLVLKCCDHISSIMAFTWKKQVSFSWKHTKPPELRPDSSSFSLKNAWGWWFMLKMLTDGDWPCKAVCSGSPGRQTMWLLCKMLNSCCQTVLL